MKCSLRSTVFHFIVLFISIFLCLVKHFIHKYFFTLTLYIFSTNFSMKSLFRRHSCCVVYSLDQGSQILIFLRKTSVFRDQPHIFLVYLITHILPHVLEKDSWLPHDSRISWKLHFKRIFSENFLNFSKYSSNKVLFFTNFPLLSTLLDMGEWAKIGNFKYYNS